MRGNRPSLTSGTQGRREKYFSQFFFKGASCPKNSGRFTGRQNFTTVQFHRVRETRGHLQKLWQRDPPVTRGATAPKFGSNFGQNSNGPKNKGGDLGIFGGVQLKPPRCLTNASTPDPHFPPKHFGDGDQFWEFGPLLLKI